MDTFVVMEYYAAVKSNDQVDDNNNIDLKGKMIELKKRELIQDLEANSFYIDLNINIHKIIL